MDKFVSFLCCSLDSRDDSDENKYQGNNRNQSRRTNKPISSEENLKQNGDISLIDHNGKKKKDKKDKLDYDDNSVNETETIANTNEEPTPISEGLGHRGTSGARQGESNSSSSDDNLRKNSVNSENLQQRQEDNVILANADDSEDLPDLNADDMDRESIMDLTKFQDGQYFNPESGWLLGPKSEKFKNKKCLILDLDETLVHSSFKYLRTADFVIPVEIDNQTHHVYVIKRPGVDEFLKKVGEWYEVVVFTASVLKYGDPLLDKLDLHNSVHHRLFRDSCFNYQGNFIKNLSQIGRPLSESIIIDNSPASYIFHPQHSVPISSWFSDTHDNELTDLLPFLKDLSKTNVDDVSLVLDIML